MQREPSNTRSDSNNQHTASIEKLQAEKAIAEFNKIASLQALRDRKVRDHIRHFNKLKKNLENYKAKCGLLTSPINAGQDVHLSYNTINDILKSLNQELNLRLQRQEERISNAYSQFGELFANPTTFAKQKGIDSLRPYISALGKLKVDIKKYISDCRLSTPQRISYNGHERHLKIIDTALQYFRDEIERWWEKEKKNILRLRADITHQIPDAHKLISMLRHGGPFKKTSEEKPQAYFARLKECGLALEQFKGKADGQSLKDPLAILKLTKDLHKVLSR